MCCCDFVIFFFHFLFPFFPPFAAVFTLFPRYLPFPFFPFSLSLSAPLTQSFFHSFVVLLHSLFLPLLTLHNDFPSNQDNTNSHHLPSLTLDTPASSLLNVSSQSKRTHFNRSNLRLTHRRPDTGETCCARTNHSALRPFLAYTRPQKALTQKPR